MTNHRLVNWRKYERAQELIQTGTWVIDPHAGTLWSTKFQRLIKPNLSCARGRYTVAVWIPETRRQLPAYLHRIVWEYVHGRIDPELEVNHIDGVVSNNGIANLELVTPSGNVQHALRTGLIQTIVHAPLKQDIERALQAGEPHTSIMKRFGVSYGTVNRIHQARSDYVPRKVSDPNAVAKTCSTCGIVKPIKDFYLRSSGSSDGRKGTCRSCLSDYSKRLRAKASREP